MTKLMLIGFIIFGSLTAKAEGTFCTVNNYGETISCGYPTMTTCQRFAAQLQALDWKHAYIGCVFQGSSQ